MVGSFWWKAQTALLDQFKCMARCTIGNGTSASFWFDLWSTQCLHIQLPHIFSFAKNQYISVQKFMATEFMEDLFHLPLSTQAFQEFQIIDSLCQEFNLRSNSTRHDQWSYIWGSKKFSTARAYSSLIGVKSVPPHFNWI